MHNNRKATDRGLRIKPHDASVSVQQTIQNPLVSQHGASVLYVYVYI